MDNDPNRDRNYGRGRGQPPYKRERSPAEDTSRSSNQRPRFVYLSFN